MKGNKGSKNQFKIRRRLHRKDLTRGGWKKWIAKKRGKGS